MHAGAGEATAGHERLRSVALPGGGAITPDAGKNAGQGANRFLARRPTQRPAIGEVPAVASGILRSAPGATKRTQNSA